MATNATELDTSSDEEVLPSADVLSSDSSDCDEELLFHAEDIMQKISPKKKKSRKEMANKRNINSTQKIKSTKKISLNKSEIREICDYLEINQTVVLEKTTSDLIGKEFWDSHTGYREALIQCMSQSDFAEMITCIVGDFRRLYIKNNTGTAKYDHMQLEWFQNASRYLKSDNFMNNLSLEESVIDIKHFLSCIVSNLHSIVFDKSCSLIIQFLSNKNASSQVLSNLKLIQMKTLHCTKYMDGYCVK